MTINLIILMLDKVIDDYKITDFRNEVRYS